MQKNDWDALLGRLKILLAFQIGKDGCNSTKKTRRNQEELGDYLVEEKIVILCW